MSSKTEQARQAFETQEDAARKLRQRAGRSLRTHTEDVDQRQQPTEIAGVSGRTIETTDEDNNLLSIQAQARLILTDDGVQAIPGKSQFPSITVGTLRRVKEELVDTTKNALDSDRQQKKKIKSTKKGK